MNRLRILIALLIVIAVSGVLATASMPPRAVQEPEELTVVPRTPVVYEGMRIQAGLQLPDGTWKTRPVQQRIPCIGKITAGIPIFSAVQVEQVGSGPEWKEVPIEFKDIERTFTTRVLIVPTEGVIDDLQVNVPAAGRLLRIEAETAAPIAVMELVGETTLELELPRITREIAKIVLNILDLRRNINLDEALSQLEIPNMHLRWIPVSAEGIVEFVSPDPNMPPGLQQQLANMDTVRIHIIGAGSLRLLR
ncbi:MAG: hypothetical protein D6723_04245 [Acidobacteria bacterium]|nr:MAG: hypothetical protein D6723_04245 [Acidobacteriota bacterium]